MMDKDRFSDPEEARREMEEILSSPNPHEAIRQKLRERWFGPASFELALPFLTTREQIDSLEVIFEHGLETGEKEDCNYCVRRATELGLEELAAKFKASLGH